MAKTKFSSRKTELGMPCENDTAQGADQEPAAAIAAGKGSIVFCSQNQQAVLRSYQKDC